MTQVEERQINQPADPQIITSLQELIKAHIQSIQNLKKENKEAKEMIEDMVTNDAVYKEKSKVYEESKREIERLRAGIMAQPFLLELADNRKTRSSELREKQLFLSDYLLEYNRLTQATQLELFEGEITEIIKSAKVLRKRKK